MTDTNVHAAERLTDQFDGYTVLAVDPSGSELPNGDIVRPSRPSPGDRSVSRSLQDPVSGHDQPGRGTQKLNVCGTRYRRAVWNASDSTASGAAPFDDGLARRLKALACTAPLHDLDARKTRLDFAEAAIYQMAEIAFHLIDQVTVAMDFDRGANHDSVIARTVPFVAAQAPDRSSTEHKKVARWVLDNLINVGTTDRGFRAVYGAFGQTGSYERHGFDFKLLIELADSNGEVYLRASDEAINVLIGALDTDVESAQIAAEIKLDNLIRRGKLSDAQAAAQQARYTTVRYAERLREKLEATRRDVRTVDWETDVPTLIEDALTHVADRYRAETAILANIRKARDEAEEPERKRKAAYLVEIVADCINRHTQLQTRLLEAGSVFRAEQDRQQFSGPARRATVDLFGQLLSPALALPLADAARPTGAFFHAVTGLAIPVAPRLCDLVRLLITPAAERDDLITDVLEPDLMPLPDPEVFTEEQWAQTDVLMDVEEVHDGCPGCSLMPAASTRTCLG